MTRTRQRREQCPLGAVSALTATRNREALLVSRALPSIACQTRPPDSVVIVNDGEPLDAGTRDHIASVLGRIPFTLVSTSRPSSGAACAWNTGLRVLVDKGRTSWVAFLDDDDAWDPDHIAVNLAARGRTTNAVVSGLRIVAGGDVVYRSLPRSLSDRDFLVGNPGWQGSNTFVRLKLLEAVGGFRPGLACLNDRDLAIRLLRHPDVRLAYTGRWTASWYADTPGALSEAGSAAKLSGLASFWRLYGDEMTADERCAFFARARDLFRVPEDDVLELSARIPPPHHPELGARP